MRMCGEISDRFQAKKAVMADDGINDVPAFTQATVEVAIGPRSDFARKSLAIVLIDSDPA